MTAFPVLDRARQRAAAFAAAQVPDPAIATVVNRLAKKIEQAQGEVGHVIQYAEVDRIVALPFMQPMDLAEIEAFQRENVLADAYERGFRLFDLQCEMVAAYEQFGGGFFPVGVGLGKALTTLIIAQKAFNKGLRKVLLHVPSQVYFQLTQVDIRWARARVPLNYPIHLMGNRTAPVRRGLANSGRWGLYIMPYSLLSTKDADENITAIKPELIIADEGHNLANRPAARTRRMLRYVEAHKPEGVVLSGTVTSKSVMDYYHLIRWCLGDNCPLPKARTMAEEWGVLIDADATPYGEMRQANSSGTGPLLPVVHWARRRFPNMAHVLQDDVPGFRRAYKLRMNSAPGVVASGDAEIGTSLTIANTPVADHEKAEGWDRLQELMDKVSELMVTPNGDEIEWAIHCWKWLNELTAGFYNEMIWPDAAKFAARRGISAAQAEDLLERAKKHHVAGQDYSHELRDFLKEAKPGMDTPLLAGSEMERNGPQHVGRDLYDKWRYWHSLDFEGRPERDSRSVRVCPYKIDAGVAWAKQLPDRHGLEKCSRRKGGIVWYYHQEIGKWLVDAMKEAGIEALHCPAGESHNRTITAVGDPSQNGKGDQIVIASISAHGTGKNLQAFEHQYFVQWPRQATAAEQTIGRTHRAGQKADEMTVVTCLTTEFDQLNFAACLNDALYVHQTTGNRQKLIYASYDPLPRIFPPAVLHERGLQNRMLTAEQQREMRERFGGESGGGENGSRENGGDG